MFTERLNKLMKIIGAKPTDIAGIIGCDRSAVDRICKGSRVPQNGGKSASRIVLAIYSFADEHGKTADVLNEIGCSVSSSAEQIKGEIMRWLYDGEESIKAHKEAPRFYIPTINLDSAFPQYLIWRNFPMFVLESS